jgi:hypothetical protein
MTKPHEQEPSEASPPTKPAAGVPLRSINEPQAPTAATGDLPSINEPPGSNVSPSSPAGDGHEKSPQVTDVSRETDHGNKRHR